MRRVALSTLRRDAKFLLDPQDAIEYRVLWPTRSGITVTDYRGQWETFNRDAMVVEVPPCA